MNREDEHDVSLLENMMTAGDTFQLERLTLKQSLYFTKRDVVRALF